MALMFVCTAALSSLVLLLLLPPAGSTSVLLVELGAAVAAAAVLSLALERWNRSRIVDLRHNDLAESFKYGLLPKEPELPVGAVRKELRTRTTESGTSLQHRLFGQCDCAECVSGIRPATIDLRQGEAPSPGSYPDDDRRTSSF